MKKAKNKGTVVNQLFTSPFKTAIKLTLGVFVAQLIVGAITMAALGGGAYIAYKSGVIDAVVTDAVGQ